MTLQLDVIVKHPKRIQREIPLSSMTTVRGSESVGEGAADGIRLEAIVAPTDCRDKQGIMGNLSCFPISRLSLTLDVWCVGYKLHVKVSLMATVHYLFQYLKYLSCLLDHK